MGKLEQLWHAINAYAVSVGGDPTKHVYDNVDRENAAAEIKRLLGYMVTHEPWEEPPTPEFQLQAHGSESVREFTHGLTPEQVEAKKGELFAFITESRNCDRTGQISLYGHLSLSEANRKWLAWFHSEDAVLLDYRLGMAHSEHGLWVHEWAKWTVQNDENFPVFFQLEVPDSFPVTVAPWWDSAEELKQEEIRKTAACKAVQARWPDVDIINVYDKYTIDDEEREVQVYFRPPGFRGVVLCEPLKDPNVATPSVHDLKLWKKYTDRLRYDAKNNLWTLTYVTYD